MPPKRKSLSSSSKPTSEFGIKWFPNAVDKNVKSLHNGRHLDTEDVDSDASTEPETTSKPGRGNPSNTKTPNQKPITYEIVKPKKKYKIDWVHCVRNERNKKADKLSVDGFHFRFTCSDKAGAGINWFRCSKLININLRRIRCPVRAGILNDKLISLDGDHAHARPVVTGKSPSKSTAKPRARQQIFVKPPRNCTVEWIACEKDPERELLHVNGHRFYLSRARTMDSGQEVKWFRCADTVLRKQYCAVKAAILEGKLVSLSGKHEHAPHIATNGSRTDLNHHSNESEPLVTDRIPSPVRPSTPGQGSESMDEVSHDEEPESDSDDQSTCEPKSETVSLNSKSRDEESFLSILSGLTKESEKLDMVRNKPLPMSIRVKFLEKELNYKEAVIENLAAELCSAKVVNQLDEEKILKLETELKASKENNGKIVEKYNKLLVERMLATSASQ
ncbi:hypothetical protein HDE_07917 [Halotydeus destructor]|nr:hypothetical protein HDE_07917 [Halotydeus destructor]